MFLRDFLNAILAFIGASSLTDVEYSSVNVLDIEVGVYNLAAYTQLSNVLISREAVSTTTDRLRYFFMSKDVNVPAPAIASSNIFVGSVL